MTSHRGLFQNDMLSHILLCLAKETACTVVKIGISTISVSCCATDCAIHFSTDSNVTFHHIPVDVVKRDLCTKAISHAKWELKAHHRLCSKPLVLGRPSKDPKDVDFVPTVFKNGKEDRCVQRHPVGGESAEESEQWWGNTGGG